MRLTRIHVPGPLAAGREITLPAQAAEHLARVLRLESGAPFVVFDGLGGEFAATLGARSGKQLRARVLHAVPFVERESPLDLTLVQGIARGERMDFIVQKATELGVTRIVPFTAERSVVRVDAKQRERKHEHWHSVAVSACEQCGRNRVPAVSAPLSLEQALAGLPADSLRCLLAADGAQSLVTAAAGARGRPCALLIGPEGGLTEGEAQLALTQQFIACRLGPRVLRTETAGLAALAALQAVSGDFIDAV
jgi:16S rRNA (uracil1498-N3)-methyltransferase